MFSISVFLIHTFSRYIVFSCNNSFTIGVSHAITTFLFLVVLIINLRVQVGDINPHSRWTYNDLLTWTEPVI